MLLLILWGFDIIQASTLSSQSCNVCPAPALSPPPNKIKIKKSNLCYLCTRYNEVKLSVPCLFPGKEPFPSRASARSLQRGGLHFSVLITLEESSLLVSCPGCYFQRRGLLLKASLSLVPNCASAVINTTATVASLLVTVSGSMERGLANGFCRQYKPLRWPPPAVGKWTQTRSSEAAWTRNIQRASGDFTGHSHQYSLR